MLADLRKSLAGIEALAFVDVRGGVAAASRDWPAAVRDVADQEFYRHLSGGGDHALFVGAPVKDPTTGRWSSALARPIDDESGKFAGLVVARWSLTELEEFYRVAMPPGRTVTVLRRDGLVLARYPHWEEVIGHQVPHQSPWFAIVAAGGGPYLGKGLLDTPPVVASVRPLDDLPLVVAAAGTETEALSGWQRQRVWLVGGGTAAGICVILLLRYLGVQFRRLETSELSLAEKNAQLELTRQQLDAALSNIVQGVGFFSADAKLVVCNSRFGEIYKLPPDLMRPGTSLGDIIDKCIESGSFHDMTRDAYLRSVETIVHVGRPHHAISHFKDGRTIAVQRMPMPGGAWVATHEDITERRLAEEKIVYLARHDVLTGLANRSLFEERIGLALAGARRGALFAVLFLDLDRFKMVNDTLGHQVGDDLLRAVAGRLLENVREQDTVARFGGDEFVVLQLGVTRTDDAAYLARRILDAFAVPFEVGGHHLVVGTSIGVATAPNDGDSAETLLKNADLALYISKSEGRGRFRFFEPAMDAKAQRRHAMERDLRRAIERGEFDVYYQPVIELPTNRIRTIEALIRWHHPERGLVAPGDFIPVAEDCGLIGPIGEWVLGQACRDAVGWPDDIHVAVNFSPVQFRDGRLVETVAAILAASGLSARRLELEITETVLLTNNAANLSVLHELRDLGIGIVMDDFGIGYSSLSYLRYFPFDKIKIDQSFIKEITIREDVLFIVRAISRLCRDLGIRATAEGVETKEQLTILLAEGCPEAQGYFFGHPRPADQLGELIGGAAPHGSPGRAALEQATFDAAR